MYVDPKVRIMEIWMDEADHDVDLSAEDIAMAMIDQDVSRGEYEGCSTELELAFTEYVSMAKAVL